MTSRPPAGFDPEHAHHMKRGGLVPGQGQRDSVPTMLTPGEYVMPKDSVQAIGPAKLDAMRAATHARQNPQSAAADDFRVLVLAAQIHSDPERLAAALQAGEKLRFESPKRLADGGLVLGEEDEDPFRAQRRAQAAQQAAQDQARMRAEMDTQMASAAREQALGLQEIWQAPMF